MLPSKQFVDLDKNQHDRLGFKSGEEELDVFIQKYAARHQAAGISKTMVLPDIGGQSICAFYTLTHTEIQRTTLPQNIAKRLPIYPIPVLLIAQLAVHSDLQGGGMGKITLIRALQHCVQIHAYLPSFAIVVDALNESVKSFYEQYGFEVLDKQGQRVRLYLPMKVAKNLF